MTMLSSLTLLSRDEEFNPAARMSEQITRFLENVQMDTYNEEYVVQVTISKVDTKVSEHEQTDDDDIPF